VEVKAYGGGGKLDISESKPMLLRGKYCAPASEILYSGLWTRFQISSRFLSFSSSNGKRQKVSSLPTPNIA